MPSARGALGVVAALCGALAGPVRAQEAGEATAPAAAVNPSAIGISLSRVQQGVRAAAERQETDGRNLRVFVTVFGESPPLIFLPQGGDEPFFTGPPADGPPTHADLQRVRTPQEFRSPVMDFGAAIAWLRDQFRKEESR